MLVEHHQQKAEHISNILKHGRHQNWKAIVSPARAKNVGTTGGELIFAKEHLDLRPAPLPASLPAVGLGFAMGLWRFRRCEVLVVAGYMRPWVTNEARAVWRALAARIHTMGVPAIVAGDWNMTRDRLTETGWPGKLGLVPVQTTPPDHPTCTQGGQKAIDFFLVSEAIADLVVSSEVVLTLGFKPHYGVRLFLRGRPRDLWRRQLRQPRPWPGHDDRVKAATVKMECISWGEAVCKVRAPSWKQVSAEMELRGHLAHWPREWVTCADELGQRAVLWSAAAEQQLGSMLGEVDGRHLGRGRAPIFEWKRVLPVRLRGAVGPHESMLYFVTVLAARLQELVSIVANKACGTALCQGLLRLLRHLSLPVELAKEKVEADGPTWGCFVRRPLTFHRGFLDRASETIGLRAERLEREVAQSNRLKFAAWVDEAMHHTKVAHMWCKQNDTEEELLAQQRARSQGHLQAMDLRTAFWRSHWQRHAGEWSELADHVASLRQQVSDDIKEDRVQLISEEQLDMAIGEYKPCKAKGTDGWSTALLIRLGSDARMELLSLFRACEGAGMWPTCWMATMAKFIPKPDGVSDQFCC